MNFTGKPVDGFKEFLKRNPIEISEPVELNASAKDIRLL
jgi:hypothetical protein